jgi:dUTP pyrophosphatase
MRLLIQTSEDYLKGLYSEKLKNYKSDSGLDLYVPEDTVIPAKSISFMLDLQITCKMESESMDIPIHEISKPYMIFPRSSTGFKTPLRLGNSIGLIDKDYRGHIMLILDNVSDEDFHVKKGSRLVQIVAFNGEPFKFKMVSKLEDTKRGVSGIGSTGS